MNLEAYYLISQIAAALAVIATLLYGIAQIKINNRLMRAEQTTSIVHGLHGFNLAVGLDQDASRIWREGLRGLDLLNPDEKTQFSMLCSACFNGYEAHFLLDQVGLIHSEMVERAELQMRFILSRPGAREWWPRYRENFNQSFRARGDAIVQSLESPTNDTDDYSAPFR